METIGKYILDRNGEPISETDVTKWAMWFESADRTVAITHVGKVTVSTVFLGLDHGWDGKEAILWETMIFGGRLKEQHRCSGSREQAEAMHKEMVRKVSNPE